MEKISTKTYIIHTDDQGWPARDFLVTSNHPKNMEQNFSMNDIISQ